jgi:hypothetical protein
MVSSNREKVNGVGLPHTAPEVVDFGSAAAAVTEESISKVSGALRDEGKVWVVMKSVLIE